MPTYEVRCEQCGDYEIEKPMRAPLPRCSCGRVLKQIYTVPVVQFNAAGFYTTDVARFDNLVGPERAARVKRQNEAATARARAGTQTAYERAVEEIV